VHARIVNGELVQEDVRGGPREAFDYTHLLIRALSSAALSHWSAKPAPFPVKVDRFDDKGIPFPMATRVAHPLTYIPMGPPIQRNDAHVVDHFAQHREAIAGLHALADRSVIVEHTRRRVTML